MKKVFFFFLQASPLGHMATIFEHIMKACSNPACQQPPSQTLAAQSHLLRPLHTLITACIETPTAAVDPNPVDIALYEALADALAPAISRTLEEEQRRDESFNMQNQAVGIPTPAGSSELLQRQLLHLVLGTYLRRYLNRWSPQPRQLLSMLRLKHSFLVWLACCPHACCGVLSAMISMSASGREVGKEFTFFLTAASLS